MKKRFFLLSLILFFLILKTYIIQPFRSIGISMEPTIEDEKIVFVNKIVYRFRKPKIGEIIVFRTTENPPLYFLKRIVATEGEIIEFKNGEIFLNGKILEEPYVIYRSNWNTPAIKVKKDCVFVVGDNRGMSASEHLFTQVAIKNIIGRVIGFR